MSNQGITTMAQKVVEKHIIDDQTLDNLIGSAKTADDLFGEDGLVKCLTSKLIERMLEDEITHHLGYDKHSKEGHHTGNSRNGKTQKTVKTSSGELSIAVPRDRQGEFDPQVIEKRQSRLAGLDKKVLSLYSRGMTNRDITAHLEEIYGTSASRDLISRITDGILEEVNQWLNRPLDAVYPIIYIDGFMVNCRLEGHVSKRTVYVIYGITMEGCKEVLGLYLGEAEGAKFWLSVLNKLKNRGLTDIFILCADGLTGLPEAVEAAFPKTIFQTCIVHLVRNSLKYVPYKEKKAVADDLKKIYQANTVELAVEALDDFELNWGDKYPAIVKSWRTHWSKVIPFFDYPKDIRRIIYTTNIIESLNRTLRKAVKNRGQFSTEDAVMKVLYLSIKNVSKKWTMPVRDWTGALNQFAIVFGDRFPAHET